jgi:hypothetical protein
MSNTPAEPPAFVPINLDDAKEVVDAFRAGARANLESPLRHGSIVKLPNRGRVLVTGDLHDNVYNLARILQLARLDKSPDNHLILHEIVHGKDQNQNADLSVRTLALVAALKVQFPEQVHILLGNHELSQIGYGKISKNGIDVNQTFNNGIDHLYATLGDEVRIAMARFVKSMLLAVSLPNGIMVSHSLPGDNALEKFDASVLYRVPDEMDLRRHGPAFDLVWGRGHSAATIDELSDLMGVDLFIIGHMQAPEGYHLHHPKMLIIASDHAYGVAVPIDLERTGYTMEDVLQAIVPLASVRMSR